MTADGWFDRIVFCPKQNDKPAISEWIETAGQCTYMGDPFDFTSFEFSDIPSPAPPAMPASQPGPPLSGRRVRTGSHQG